MKKARRGLGSLRMVMVGVIAVAGTGFLSACNDSGGSKDQSGATSSTGAGAAATITGNAITTATVGKAYSFQPQASSTDTMAAISFSITNKPAWASFNAATGQLSGTPSATDVGKYPGIQIAALIGKVSTSLPAFSINVTSAGAASSSVSLNWMAPTENSDGTQLQDLKGYKIHYGTDSQTYTGAISVDNPTLTTYLVDTLPAGTYYFAVTAYNSKGLESSPSDEVAVSFN